MNFILDLFTTIILPIPFHVDTLNLQNTQTDVLVFCKKKGVNTMSQKYVSYYRVSTQKQGHSGLGLESQKQTVLNFLNGGQWEIVKEFTEVESGKKNNRKELEEAIKYCKLTGSTLLIAKLDRLSRNLNFITTLQESNVSFVCCDMPDANSFTIQVMAALAQKEVEMISERTRLALAQCKQRGVRLGMPENLTDESRKKGWSIAINTIKSKSVEFSSSIYEIIHPMVKDGKTLQSIADHLNNENILTSRKKKWYPSTVRNIINRCEMNQ